MSRLVLDSVNAGKLEACRWPHLIGYVNGHISKWSPQAIAQTRAAGQLLALVDVLGTNPRAAAVLDWERGDVQSPAVLHQWVVARNQFRSDAVVYCSAASIPAVVKALRGEPCNLWVVDLTADGEPPFVAKRYPGLPGNVRVIGRQFVFGPRSGGDYDMSIFYVDNWHPDQAAPRELTAARTAAAAELGPFEGAAAAAEMTDPATGTMAAFPDPGPAEPAAAAPVSLGLADVAADLGLPAPVAVLAAAAGTTGQLATVTPLLTAADVDSDPVLLSTHRRAELERELAELEAVDLAELQAAAAAVPTPATSPEDAAAKADVDQVTAGVAADVGQPPRVPRYVVPGAIAPAAAAPVDHGPSGSGSDDLAAFRAAAAPVPVIGNDQLADVEPAAAASSAAADVDQARARLDAAAAAPVAVDAEPADQSALNHAFISRVLGEARTVAGMFHGAGKHHVGAELERAVNLAVELGTALQAAGL